MHRFLISVILLSSSYVLAQDSKTLYQTKKMATNKTIVLDSLSINPSYFKIVDSNGVFVDTASYYMDFKKAVLNFKNTLPLTDSIEVTYLKYPEFLTKTYKQIDTSVIVNSTGTLDKLYQISESNTAKEVVPFDGLTTSGSISRGVTIGNNQNSVLNSELDLQISGKISEKVTLRASIQDANIPLQQSGYSQRLDEFDQVFIEAFTDQWALRAGDIDLENYRSYFAEFSKRVQGLSVSSVFQHNTSKTTAYASGALVRGQFITSQFTAQEGNQGPYKLKGPNNELFVLVVSGSESVYVNGIALERGATKDYIIDYNAGEIIFNPTYPITSEMRIIVDYQYSERNYTRFVGYAAAEYDSEKLKFGVSFYNENDLKNQPLQQNLNANQAEILSNAGDDNSLMTAPSATPAEFSENRILYKKEIIDGEEIFVFSNNSEDSLYQVNFLFVGEQQGNYTLSNSTAISNIYSYVSPISGQMQGSYEPIVQLVAPVKLQLAVLNGAYIPNEKTTVDFELAASQNDLNTFSGISDDDNDGFAARLAVKQHILKSNRWNINMDSEMDYIHKDFRNLQGLYNPEFNRDWNLDQPTSNQVVSDFGDQLFMNAGVSFYNTDSNQINYQYQHLNFSKEFNGNRHILNSNIRLKNFEFRTNSSVLHTNGAQSKSTFIRSLSQLKYDVGVFWPGVKFSTEQNKITKLPSEDLDLQSQKFSAYETFIGVGDSTKVFMKVGYIKRHNDSVQNNTLRRVNTSDTYYANTQMIRSETSNLSLYANYRVFKPEDENKSIQKILNSRLFYDQKLAKNLVQWQSVYETSSGQLPQQDFTYVEVEPGQGSFMWLDYNGNGIQELEEFEVAQFQDQATYIRVLLPNQVYIRTHQNRLSQSLTIDPIQWSGSSNKAKRFWSHFYNQTTFLIDRKQRNNGQNINLNPFQSNSENQLAMQSNFRNQLFFNRGKQHYTVSYSFSGSEMKNVLSFGSIAQKSYAHQLNFTHKIQQQWLLNFQFNFDNNKSESENYSSKNFELDQILMNPKISYLLDDNKRFDVFYQFQQQDNLINDKEYLKQHKLGVSAVMNQNTSSSISAEFNYFSNAFKGNANTPIAYQMMEGLQPGTNFTWSLIAQKKLTKFLDLNLNYFGRKTENSRTIHTGTVQLKAYF
jgi:hypothetical protein